MTQTPFSPMGLSDAAFDELAAQVANAFRDDNPHRGLELQQQLCLEGLVPHMKPRLRWTVHYASLDRADVQGEVVARVLTSLQLGKKIQQAMLWQIYKRVAYDMNAWGHKHEDKSHRATIGPDQVLEDIITRARTGEKRPLLATADDGESEAPAPAIDPAAGQRIMHDDTFASDADFRTMRDAVAAELATMKPPAMRGVWLAMCEGHFDGPDVAKQLNITSGLVRQCKTYIRNFLLGTGRDLISNLDMELER